MLTDGLSHDELVVLKVKLLGDFGYFARFFFKVLHGSNFFVAEHHRLIIERLTDVVRGDCRRLIINIPPRYGKTELAVRLFVAWCIANNPRAKFIHVSFSDSLAMDNSDAIRDVLRSDEWRLLFPDITISRKTDAKNKWYTEEGGGVYATSFGGPITGFGAGISGPRQYTGNGLSADGFGGAIIVDDPMKAADALSETMRERLNFRINNTLMSRLNNPAETPVIVIMQRLHEEDTTGFLLNGGTGDKWEHLKLSAIREDGTALWPEKHSIAMLEQMRAADSYTFAGQYMQEPASPGGNVFMRDWFRFYDDATLPITFDRIVQSWDFTFKNTEGADNVCGTVWGCKGPNRYLLDCMCRKMNFTEQIASMRVMCDKWPQAVAKYVEDKANGSAIIDALRSKVQGIVPVTPTKSKMERAMAVTPLFEAGNVWFPKKDRAPWIGEFMDELATFPNAKHDDRVDSTTQALSQTSRNYMRIWD